MCNFVLPDVISHLFPNFNSSLTKVPLKSGVVYMIIPQAFIKMKFSFATIISLPKPLILPPAVDDNAFNVGE